MRTRVIVALKATDLEDRINEFINDKAVVDIKFQALQDSNVMLYAALIMYGGD